MTTTLSIMGALAYLGAGVAVASYSAKHEFTLSVRWWHVVFWPVIPLGYGFVTLGFWMAGKDH